MKNCKNTECNEKVKKEKNMYCSLKCRNIYVNKNIRDYAKLKNIAISNENKYNENPVKCKKCGISIDYRRRNNTFCSQSCSASFSNKDRFRSEESRNKIRDKLTDFYKDKLIVIQCIFCGKDILKKMNKKLCSKDCAKKNKRKLLGDKYTYKLDCAFKFSIASYPNEFDFELLKKYGLYKAKNKGDNLGGVSRDHIYSISEGYKNGVDPYIISHPANCRLMIHKHNSSKHSKSHISIKELLDKITEWEIKYGKFIPKIGS